MNADGSNVHRVSNGKGATTCGYFFRMEKDLILCIGRMKLPTFFARRRGRSQQGLRGSIPDTTIPPRTPARFSRTTSEPGYDAEATVNFKTKKIIYIARHTGAISTCEANLDGSGKIDHYNGRLRRRRDLSHDGRNWCGARIIQTLRRR